MAPCSRRNGASSMRERPHGWFSRRPLSRAASLPCWAIITHAQAIFSKLSTHGCRPASPRYADRPPRKRSLICARAFRCCQSCRLRHGGTMPKSPCRPTSRWPTRRTRSHPNVYGPYSRALKLCPNYGTIREKTTGGISIAKIVNCELSRALEHAQKFLQRAQEWRDEEATLMAYTSAMLANFFVGRLRQANELAGLIRARYNAKEHSKLGPDISTRSAGPCARLFRPHRMAAGEAKRNQRVQRGCTSACR